MLKPLKRPDYLPDRHFLLDIDFDCWVITGFGAIQSTGTKTIAVSGILTSSFGGLIGDERHDVIAEHYQRSPEAFTRDLLGQYGAVIVDPDARQVVIAQDSIGLGRVFVHRRGNRLLVSSDLGALCGVLRPDQLNARYFAALLCIGAALPQDMPFQSVYALNGGLLEVHTPDGFRRERPWVPGKAYLKLGDDEAVVQATSLIEEAVQAYLPTQGIAMAEVSGGLDSSTVVATACKLGAAPEAIIYSSSRGMTGNDLEFATLLTKHLGIQLHVVDPDAYGIVGWTRPFVVGEPSAELYVESIDGQDRALRKGRADVLLTGSAGDIVFEYSGLTPVFLADSVRKLNPVAMIRDARRYADSNGNYRSALHYLQTVAVPFARLHWTGRSLFQEADIEVPSWISQSFVEASGLLAEPYPIRISGLPLPSQQFLWESVYESAAAENNTTERLFSAHTAHPLYHRPLLEFLLALEPAVRRGFGAGRKLQRAVIAGLVPDQIVNRKSKGSSQKLRELHLLESDRWYDLMTSAPQLVERGWVDRDRWRLLIDRARAGAPDMSISFTAAMDAELWLQAYTAKGFYEYGPETDPSQI